MPYSYGLAAKIVRETGLQEAGQESRYCSLYNDK